MRRISESASSFREGGSSFQLGLVIQDYDKAHVIVDFDFCLPLPPRQSDEGERRKMKCERKHLVLVPQCFDDAKVVFECWSRATPIQKLFRLQGKEIRIGSVDTTLQELRNLAGSNNTNMPDIGRTGSRVQKLGIDKVQAYPFTIHTENNGHNFGRSYTLRTTSSKERRHWVQTLTHVTKQMKRKKLVENWLEDAESSAVYKISVQLGRWQAIVKEWYDWRYSTGTIQCVIMCSFVTSVVKVAFAKVRWH